VSRVDVEVFDVAYHIIGGGEEGDKLTVQTKEEADHSLRYMLAVALLDGQVLPEQYDPDRLRQSDVQSLLRRVHIAPNSTFTSLFPEQMKCSVKITLMDGTTFQIQKIDYEGFHTRPFSGDVGQQIYQSNHPLYLFKKAKKPHDTVEHLDILTVKDLTKLFSSITKEPLP